jgi:GNAT superfamily N-acetyltransferase
MPSPTSPAAIKLRPPVQDDSLRIGRIIYEAFKSIAEQRGFPPDFPSVDMTIGFAHMLVSHPAIYGVVAEVDGKVMGSNFLDERDAIRGVGPITVDPTAHAKGIGRKLMEDVIQRARGAAGIRLVQDAHNTVSMSLYTSLGFEAKEPLAMMRGKARTRPTGKGQLRKMESRDITGCADLCRRIHGFDRANELRDAMTHFPSTVLVRDGRITAYASAPPFWVANHGVAETEEDLRELILSVAQDNPIELLVPIRRASFFRWLLDQGLRVMKPMTLMSMGDYREPAGAFYPSVAY